MSRTIKKITMVNKQLMYRMDKLINKLLNRKNKISIMGKKFLSILVWLKVISQSMPYTIWSRASKIKNKKVLTSDKLNSSLVMISKHIRFLKRIGNPHPLIAYQVKNLAFQNMKAK
jgi:hypothetical protein